MTRRTLEPWRQVPFGRHLKVHIHNMFAVSDTWRCMFQQAVRACNAWFPGKNQGVTSQFELAWNGLWTRVNGFVELRFARIDDLVAFVDEFERRLRGVQNQRLLIFRGWQPENTGITKVPIHGDTMTFDDLDDVWYRHSVMNASISWTERRTLFDIPFTPTRNQELRESIFDPANLMDVMYGRVNRIEIDPAHILTHSWVQQIIARACTKHHACVDRSPMEERIFQRYGTDRQTPFTARDHVLRLHFLYKDDMLDFFNWVQPRVEGGVNRMRITMFNGQEEMFLDTKSGHDVRREMVGH